MSLEHQLTTVFQKLIN